MGTAENVTLNFKPEAYAFMRRTVSQQRDFIGRLSINESIKKAMLDNMTKISITLDNARRPAIPRPAQ
ncbi:MAG TPA: hypothetical protein PKL97_10020 [Candidatus Omnitrophota bacterium]|nr:hypothetical protein [Candidatus Omnitrophota bacterium]